MKKFYKNNEEFECINCKSYVPKHPSSSRDHCNNCLYGLHVDVFPGDRKNKCRGILKPIGIEQQNQKIKIVYDCLKCGQRVKNVKAPDDNIENIIKLSKSVYV